MADLDQYTWPAIKDSGTLCPMNLSIVVLAAALSAGQPQVAAPKNGDVYRCAISSEQMAVFEKNTFNVKSSTEDSDQQIRVSSDSLETIWKGPLTGVLESATYKIISHSAHGAYGVLIAGLGAVRTGALVVDRSGVTVFTETVGYTLPDGTFVQETILSVCRKLR